MLYQSLIDLLTTWVQLINPTDEHLKHESKFHTIWTHSLQIIQDMVLSKKSYAEYRIENGTCSTEKEIDPLYFPIWDDIQVTDQSPKRRTYVLLTLQQTLLLFVKKPWLAYHSE